MHISLMILNSTIRENEREGDGLKMQITTVPGDIILYQGDKVTVYYASNSWNFTKLGHVNNTNAADLKSLLGSGDVQITFSLA